MTEAKLYDIAMDIFTERTRQVAKWGEQRHPDTFETEAHAAHAEHFAKLAYELDVEVKCTNWRNILDEEVKEAFTQAARCNTAALREELVQVAAVCAAWIEDLDSRKP